MIDPSLTWYYHTSAGVVGPMSTAKLIALIRARTLTSATPVSRDGVAWSPAGDVPELFSISQPKPRASFKAAVLIATGLPLAIIALTCSGLFGLAFVLSDDNSSTAVAAVNPAYVATWNYWHTLQSLVSQEMKTADQIDQIAVQIETLVVTDVDADVLQFALELAGMLRRTAQTHRQQSNPGLMLESFLRGLGGDPYGTAREQSQITQQLREQWLQIQRQSTALRVILSRRYGVEFGSL
ncbi:MAG TPA: DUF4339 domain-containing protein [Planctomycetaceae bacterium]|nr:DUF4339 domain-containing protein [Planctomycetaceae bacterium]